MKDTGLYLGHQPEPTDWQKLALEELMAGHTVAIAGKEFNELYAFLGRINQDPRKGARTLDVQTGYQLASLTLKGA